VTGAARQAIDFGLWEAAGMEDDQRSELTNLLDAARVGEPEARDRLTRAVYGELRRMAGKLMRRERPDHTLQPSALVNEALLKLFEGNVIENAPNRRYLFAAAAQAMRQILVDHARKRDAVKREGGRDRVTLDAVLSYFEDKQLDILALDEAVRQLFAKNERQGLVVSLRFFVGLSVPEVAETLEVSVATVEGDWRASRAWLRGQLKGLSF
jgi:RNA polymerase sigma-70 factor, ECF subfamily